MTYYLTTIIHVLLFFLLLPNNDYGNNNIHVLLFLFVLPLPNTDTSSMSCRYLTPNTDYPCLAVRFVLSLPNNDYPCLVATWCARSGSGWTAPGRRWTRAGPPCPRGKTLLLLYVLFCYFIVNCYHCINIIKNIIHVIIIRLLFHCLLFLVFIV